MRISELSNKEFIGTSGAGDNSYFVINFDVDAAPAVGTDVNPPVTYRVALNEIGRALINNLKLVQYNNSGNALNTLTASGASYSSTNVGQFITSEDRGVLDNAITDVSYDTTNKKFTKATRNGTAADIVTTAALLTDMDLNITQITNGAGKTIATIDESGGKVSATFQDISILSSQVSDKSDSINSNGSTLATSKAVKDAIESLDITQITNTTGKTIATIDETDGKVSATFQDISIASSQISDKGTANCVATLDANGHVPASQLPSYVDDVVNGYLYNGSFYDNNSNIIPPEDDKIYVDINNNKTYRWSGVAYIEISASLALGETSGTAYRGDYGAAAYAAAITNVDSAPTANSTHLVTSGGVAAAIAAKTEIDDTAGDGDINKVWSADKTVDEIATVSNNIAEVSNKIGTVPTGKTVQEQIDNLQSDLNENLPDILYSLNDRGDTDVAPYVFRKTGGAKNGYGREFLRKIVGGTVAWNQLCGHGNFDSESGWNYSQISGSVANNIMTVDHLDNEVAGGVLFRGMNAIKDHVYLYGFIAKNVSANSTNWNGSFYNVFDDAGFARYSKTSLSADVWYDMYTIAKATSTVSNKNWNISICNRASASGTCRSQCKNAMFIDLTQMFGIAVADAILSMETATAGSGVAWFRSLFPNSYYAYDAGSLQSVQAKEHRLSGKNLLNIFGDYITRTAIPGTYTVEGDHITVKAISAGSAYCGFIVPVTIGETYTFSYTSSVNTEYVKVVQLDQPISAINTEYGNNVNDGGSIVASKPYFLVNFTGNSNGVTFTKPQMENGSTATAYEPYKLRTYPLDSSLTLRGIPKWDSTNGLYYDGDEYKPDGSVKRKYGIVDLGTLEWTKYDVTQGTLFRGAISDIKQVLGTGWVPNCVCPLYPAIDTASRYNKSISQAINNSSIDILDNSYSDADTFKSAMSGVYLVYELATPTTEQADGYRELQISAHGGTEEFIDAGVTASTPTRDVSVPVGTETFYSADILSLIKPVNSITIGNTTITEAQLQALLALAPASQQEGF